MKRFCVMTLLFGVSISSFGVRPCGSELLNGAFSPLGKRVLAPVFTGAERIWSFTAIDDERAAVSTAKRVQLVDTARGVLLGSIDAEGVRFLEMSAGAGLMGLAAQGPEVSLLTIASRESLSITEMRDLYQSGSSPLILKGFAPLATDDFLVSGTKGPHALYIGHRGVRVAPADFAYTETGTIAAPWQSGEGLASGSLVTHVLPAVDGGTLVVILEGYRVYQIDTATWRVTRRFDVNGQIGPAAISADGKLLSVAQEKLRGGHLIYEFDLPSGSYPSPNGRILSSSALSDADITALQYSPSGNSLAVAYEDGVLGIVGTRLAQSVPTRYRTNSRTVRRLRFSPSGRNLIAGSEGNHIFMIPSGE